MCRGCVCESVSVFPCWRMFCLFVSSWLALLSCSHARTPALVTPEGFRCVFFVVACGVWCVLRVRCVSTTAAESQPHSSREVLRNGMENHTANSQCDEHTNLSQCLSRHLTSSGTAQTAYW